MFKGGPHNFRSPSRKPCITGIGRLGERPVPVGRKASAGPYSSGIVVGIWRIDKLNEASTVSLNVRDSPAAAGAEAMGQEHLVELNG